MDDSILSSPAKEHKPKEMWDKSTRSTVRSLKRKGHSWGKIHTLTGVPKSTIRDICKSKSSDNPRRGKTFKLKLLKRADTQRIMRLVSESWANRTKSWADIKRDLSLDASTTTTRRTMKAVKNARLYSNQLVQ
jgi:hypothetical protein